MPKPQIIGLSISMCIRDIIQGKIDVKDITKMIVGTRVADGDWIFVLTHYANTYWDDDVAKALETFTYMLDNDLIIQPRIYNMEAPNIAHGNWIINGIKQYLPSDPLACIMLTKFGLK